MSLITCLISSEGCSPISQVQKKVFEQWQINGTGPLATNGIDAGVKVRPTEEELTAMDKWPFPDFRSGWDSYFKDKPDKPVMHYSVIAGFVNLEDLNASNNRTY